MSKPRFDLSKKIPVNPKFAHVKSVLDTGSSATKFKDKLESIRSSYRFKKDEIFKRIKPNTFAQLVVEVADAEEELLAEELDEACAVGSARAESTARPSGLPDDQASVRTDATARSGFLSLIQGVSERDAQPLPAAARPSRCPFLLLDLRDADDFRSCHIAGAISYPVAMLSRASNSFTADIYMYSNKPGKIIIVYDEDERMAPAAATIFVQRGVDNVFMLSGGLKVLSQKFPVGFIEGVLPASCLPAATPRSRHASSSSTPATPSARLPAGPSASAASASAGAGADASAGADAVGASSLAVLPLTRENLERIRFQLEENLLQDDASSQASSRTPSRASRAGAGTPRAEATPRGATTPARTPARAAGQPGSTPRK